MGKIVGEIIWGNKFVTGRAGEAEELQALQVYSMVPSCATTSKSCLINHMGKLVGEMGKLGKSARNFACNLKGCHLPQRVKQWTIFHLEHRAHARRALDERAAAATVAELAKDGLAGHPILRCDSGRRHARELGVHVPERHRDARVD